MTHINPFGSNEFNNFNTDQPLNRNHEAETTAQGQSQTSNNRDSIRNASLPLLSMTDLPKILNSINQNLLKSLDDSEKRVDINNLAKSFNELLQVLKIDKTGSFELNRNSNSLTFKVDPRYRSEEGFIEIQKNLLEFNQFIHNKLPNLSEMLPNFNYKIDTFPDDSTRNKLGSFQNSFSWGADIINVPNLLIPDHDKKFIFPEYKGGLLVPVVMGPTSLPDLFKNDLETNLFKGESPQALNTLKKAARGLEEDPYKIDFHALIGLSAARLPNGRWTMVNFAPELVYKVQFDPRPVMEGLGLPIENREDSVPDRALVELANREKEGGNLSFLYSFTPPAIKPLLKKLGLTVQTLPEGTRVSAEIFDKPTTVFVMDPKASAAVKDSYDLQKATSLHTFVRNWATYAYRNNEGYPTRAAGMVVLPSGKDESGKAKYGFVFPEQPPSLP